MRGRADVNMPPIAETGAAKLRELTRHERKIELCFGGIRYRDLLRRGIAPGALVGEIWGAPYPDPEQYASRAKQIDPWQDTADGMWAGAFPPVRRTAHDPYRNRNRT